MSEDTPLSPLRRVLCSRTNAIRVAACMEGDGFGTAIIATDEPLQPWRVVDAIAASMDDTRACA